MTFLLDSDSAEVAGMPCDEINERSMKAGSFALLSALHRARGLPLPQPPRGPRAKFAPLDSAIAERFLRPAEPRKPLPIPGESLGRSIIRAVAAAFDVTVADVTGRSRKRYLIVSRIVASRLLRDRTWASGQARFSLPQIGRMMGRDHSTICYHLEVFDAYCRQYPFMREVYESLRDGGR